MYLETRRLTLRRMEEGDLPDYMEYAQDPECCRMMGTWCPRSDAEARESFDWLMVHEKRFYAIVLREENKCVGHIIVQNNPPVDDMPVLWGLVGRSLSFCVAKDYRRRGYASEALTAVLDYLFTKREVDYVNSGFFEFNVPSRELHRKLGFEYLIKYDVPLPEGGTAPGIETVLWNPSTFPRGTEENG